MVDTLHNAVHSRLLLLIHDEITWEKFLIVQMVDGI